MASNKIMNRSSNSSTKFDWKIENFSKVSHELLDSDVFSDVFSVGGFKWKARVFPKGWHTVPDHLSLFLIAEGLRESLNMEVSFAVTSQTDCSNTMKKEIKCNIPAYSAEIFAAGIIGWEKFMLLSEFHDPAKGYIVNDTCIIRVEFTCEMIEDGSAVKGSEPDKVYFGITGCGRLSL
ncbi:hypothetical protein C5167_000621 [Papaver somniferum]|uniref:MATH domain-containing protein n=1 Tax=Papaver somniferum TaxID=3469 RepID=A0A4Y7KRQ6_PAPSO|nr:hypothetical protein C5167_000621 [Papaver somniferum]